MSDDLKGGYDEWWALPLDQKLSHPPRVGFDIRCQRISDCMAFLEPLLVPAAARIRELEAELAAREARGVRVKPLVWYSLGAEWKASTGFGPYMVAPYDFVEWACWTPNQDIDDEPGHGLHGSEEEAKQYAQDHFRAATASALEPAPVTPAEAARVLLDDPDEMMELAIQTMRNNRLINGKRIGYLPALTAALRALADAEEVAE